MTDVVFLTTLGIMVSSGATTEYPVGLACWTDA